MQLLKFETKSRMRTKNPFIDLNKPIWFLRLFYYNNYIQNTVFTDIKYILAYIWLFCFLFSECFFHRHVFYIKCFVGLFIIIISDPIKSFFLKVNVRERLWFSNLKVGICLPCIEYPFWSFNSCVLIADKLLKCLLVLQAARFLYPIMQFQLVW